MKRAITIIRVSEEDGLKGYGPDVQADEVRAYLVEAKLTEVAQRDTGRIHYLEQAAV